MLETMKLRSSYVGRKEMDIWYQSSTRSAQFCLQVSLQTENQLEMYALPTCLSNVTSVVPGISLLGIMEKALDSVFNKLSFVNNSETHLCQLGYICTLQEVWDVYLGTLKENAT